MKAILKKIVIRLITFEARLVLKKYKPQIIAVTGSVGKTSVKDAIYTALIPSLFIRKNEKSLNGEIGTPLTILGADSGWGDPFSWARILFEGALLIILKNRYPKWLVLEVGTDHPGEIRGITRWLKPDVTVITALPEVPVHVEFFESTEALIREKRYLADALKENGTLILCGDDRKAAALKSVYDVRSILYGFGPPSDIRAEHAEIMYDENGAPLGMQFDVCHGGGAVPMALTGTLGKQQVYPLLAAHAV
ncbi:MAG: Mur ligase family protein, partial [bacterium]|nr:Mur ligase family protein [bacterium]